MVERFNFSKIFDQTSTQEEVYAGMVAPNIDGLFEGQNHFIFNAGLTNCGKVSNLIFFSGLVFKTHPSSKNLIKRDSFKSENRKQII